MAVWMEIRCDWRTAGIPIDGDDRCDSHDNAGPMEMADNSAASVALERRNMFDDAKESGWKRMGRNIACPGCARRISKGDLPADPDSEAGS